MESPVPDEAAQWLGLCRDVSPECQGLVRLFARPCKSRRSLESRPGSLNPNESALDAGEALVGSLV